MKKNGGVGLRRFPLVFSRGGAIYQLPLQHSFFGFFLDKNCMIWAFTRECPF
jgi:hypothetical protein